MNLLFASSRIMRGAVKGEKLTHVSEGNRDDDGARRTNELHNSFVNRSMETTTATRPLSCALIVVCLYRVWGLCLLLLVTAETMLE